jgi:hypothetical protein
MACYLARRSVFVRDEPIPKEHFPMAPRQNNVAADRVFTHTHREAGGSISHLGGRGCRNI